MAAQIDPSLIIDGKGPCEFCGGFYTIKADGSLRSHKCTGVDAGVIDGNGEVVETKTRATRAKTGRTRGKPPDNVGRLVGAGVTTSVEFFAKRTVANAAGLAVSDVPDEVIAIPDADADAMVKPLLNAVWPKMPDKARKGLIALADHEDLIDCFFAWSDYFKQLRKFTDTVASERKKILAQQAPNTPTLMAESESEYHVFPVQTETNGYIGEQPEYINGLGEPFIPAPS